MLVAPPNFCCTASLKHALDAQEQHKTMVLRLLRLPAPAEAEALLRKPDKDGLLPLGVVVAWNYLDLAKSILACPL